MKYNKIQNSGLKIIDTDTFTNKEFNKIQKAISFRYKLIQIIGFLLIVYLITFPVMNILYDVNLVINIGLNSEFSSIYFVFYIFMLTTIFFMTNFYHYSEISCLGMFIISFFVNISFLVSGSSKPVE